MVTENGNQLYSFTSAVGQFNAHALLKLHIENKTIDDAAIAKIAEDFQSSFKAEKLPKFAQSLTLLQRRIRRDMIRLSHNNWVIPEIRSHSKAPNAAKAPKAKQPSKPKEQVAKISKVQPRKTLHNGGTHSPKCDFCWSDAIHQDPDGTLCCGSSLCCSLVAAQ